MQQPLFGQQQQSEVGDETGQGGVRDRDRDSRDYQGTHQQAAPLHTTSRFSDRGLPPTHSGSSIQHAQYEERFLNHTQRQANSRHASSPRPDGTDSSAGDRVGPHQSMPVRHDKHTTVGPQESMRVGPQESMQEACLRDLQHRIEQRDGQQRDGHRILHSLRGDVQGGAWRGEIGMRGQEDIGIREQERERAREEIAIREQQQRLQRPMAEHHVPPLHHTNRQATQEAQKQSHKNRQSERARQIQKDSERELDSEREREHARETDTASKNGLLHRLHALLHVQSQHTALLNNAFKVFL